MSFKLLNIISLYDIILLFYYLDDEMSDSFNLKT